MKKITLPKKSVTVNGITCTPVSLLRQHVMTQEFWREDQSIDKLKAHLAIDTVLDELEKKEDQTSFEIMNKQQELLSIAMQLRGKVFPDPGIQRLYMLTYISVLEAEEVTEAPKKKKPEPEATEEQPS